MADFKLKQPLTSHESVDFAIIDVAWNGMLESLKIAAMADAARSGVVAQPPGEFRSPPRRVGRGAVPDSGLAGRSTSSATQPFRSIPASFSSTAQSAAVSWLPRPCATPA
jgi:hypothetical protein